MYLEKISLLRIDKREETDVWYNRRNKRNKIEIV